MNKCISGKVVSCVGDKTVSMLVKTVCRHPLYKNSYTRFKKFMVHDPKNICKLGDVITAKLCAPISKRKSWCLVEIVNDL